MSTAAQPASSTAAGGYSVAHAQAICSVSGRALLVGEKCMGAVRETPAGLERLDVAIECWEGLDKSGLLAFWQFVMPSRQVKRKVFVDDGVLGELFERLADATEPAKLNFRFVLGLVLMRKRLLIYENSRNEEENEIWSVRLKGREELSDLVNPKLNEQQVAEVSTQLGDILNGDAG